MKTLYFLLAAWTLLHSTNVHAQLKNVELSIGGNGSTFKGDEYKLLGDEQFLRRYAIHISVLMGWKVGEYSEFKTGLSYCSRGASFLIHSSSPSPFGYGTGSATTENVVANYYEIPVLYLIGSETFRVHFGPQYSFLSSSNLNFMGKSDFGLKYGAGIEGKRGILIRVNFYNGLTSIFEPRELNTKNNYFQVAFGYKFIIR